MISTIELKFLVENYIIYKEVTYLEHYNMQENYRDFEYEFK